MAIRSVDPSTGVLLESFDPLSAEELERRLALAEATSWSYRATSFEDRAAMLRAAADLLDEDRSRIARTMTQEMGKTLRSAEAEAAKCATAMRFYADHAAALLAEEPLSDPGSVGASRASVQWHPLGVVLAVMPWNFPLWQVIRFSAPALMAGNVALLKHASNVPRCALYLEDLHRRAGFPEGCFQTLLIEATAVEGVLRDPRVAAATVTGSEGAGRAVAAVAGDEVKPTVLELGGSDPFVVMPSADVSRAAEVAVTARTQNNGQSCIAAKRFIVHRSVHDSFCSALVRRMESLRMGDPLDKSTDVGPLATEQGRTDIEELVEDAVAQGATVLCGGAASPGPGWFYPPTVVTRITPSMRIHREETFAPVATVYEVEDIEAAISLANDTPFGLGSNAWTTDPTEAARFVAELDAGAVFVNGMTTSFPELPFGGVKRSGYGRELGAPGIRAFCNQKTVWVGPLR